MSFENLGPVDESQPEARNTSRGYVPKAKGPAGTVLNELIVDLLVRRRWAIHTAAARLGIERQTLYKLLGGPRRRSTAPKPSAGGWDGRIPDFPEQCVGKDGL